MWAAACIRAKMRTFYLCQASFADLQLYCFTLCAPVRPVPELKLGLHQHFQILQVGNLQKPVSLVTVTPPYELQKFTGGDSGIPWGTGGIWLEPWDMKSARETVDKLRRNWHKEKPGPSSSLLILQSSLYTNHSAQTS